MFKVGDEVWVKGVITNDEDYGAVVLVDGMGKAFFNKKELIPADKTYEQGLADAWELAKKICALKNADFDKVFGCIYFADVFCNFTYEKAFAKIEAYEKEKEIKVGDELVHGEGCLKTTFIVTFVDKNRIEGIEKSGHPCSFSLPHKYFEKTNKHIDIESLLKKIGE